MKQLLVTILKFLGFLAIGLTILYLVYQQQAKAYQEECAVKFIAPEDCSLIDKVVTDFQNANYWWILIVLLLFTLSNVSRAIRWQMLLKPLGRSPKLINCFLSVLIGYFANLGIPRMGEVVRGGTLSQYENMGMEKVMGTIVVDRIIDVLSILFMTALALVFAFPYIWPFFSEHMNIGEKLTESKGLLILLAILGLGGLYAFWRFRNSLLQTKIGQKLVGIIDGFVDGLKTVRSLDKPGWFIFHSINIWVMYYLMTYLCFFAFAPTAHLGLIPGLVVFVFGGWGMVVPSPGGMGTYHFMVQTALSIFGISGEDGFSFANIAFFSIQLGCNVLLGLVALIALPIINRNYHPAPLEKMAYEVT